MREKTWDIEVQNRGKQYKDYEPEETEENGGNKASFYAVEKGGNFAGEKFVLPRLLAFRPVWYTT